MMDRDRTTGYRCLRAPSLTLIALLTLLLPALGLLAQAEAAPATETPAKASVSAAPPEIQPPDPPVTAFQAELCEGGTNLDPRSQRNDPDTLLDATRVFARRLDIYNQGLQVPLYDATGGSHGQYTPICVTRYDAQLDRAVSQWVYCTDLGKAACAGADAAGNLVETALTPEKTEVSAWTDQPGNSRVDADGEALIAWLLTHDLPYAGVGAYRWGGVAKTGVETTMTRLALQTLIWCVSDPAAKADHPTNLIGWRPVRTTSPMRSAGRSWPRWQSPRRST